MRTRPGGIAAFAVLLSLALPGCGAPAEEPAGAGGAAATPVPAEVSRTNEPAPEPESAEDFLDLAEKAMDGESGWSFSVRGEEGLTLQGRKSAATYRGAVERAVGRAALHTQGVSTGSKGRKRTEELYVVGETGCLKEGAADWKPVSPADPETRNKADDPLAVLAEFRSYAQAAGGDVEVTTGAGGADAVELRVASGERKLSEVRGRAWAQKARRELAPTAGQLREAGIPVEERQLTLSGLEEVLVLDAATYRIRSHRLDFGFLIPHSGGSIAFEQQVTHENQGPYEGAIELPAGAC
ncbi:hypothetical protein [Streptomyces sp. t39]|uniref:hypothetical protein n=1 Tax=Streptomyces sp. t39 TaxID=1828156 RepID=UPI0011CDE756|nr:hypothetical protein [Streptomyces sp. t39]TXS56565.1 hypothetical protein EAO77_10940 [Streptomyces sp. t39]